MTRATTSPSTSATKITGTRLVSTPESRGERARARTFASQVTREAFARVGARLGLAWVIILVLASVFAPFLANSRPLVIKWTDGTISYPVLDGLTPTDVTLLGMFGLLLVLLLVPRMTMFMRFLIVGCAGFACYLLCAPSVGVPYVFYETRSFTDPNLMQDRLLLAACIPIIIALLISPVVHWVFKILFTLAIGGLMAAHLMNVNLVRPPENVTYEQWRVASEEGQVEWMVLAPVPYSPRDRVRDVAGSASLLKPDDLHYLGTDRNSADVFSRVIHASRIAISIGFISTGIALVIGVFIGGLMGYFSGVVDMLGMRLLEMFQAIPPLFLLLTFVAFWGRNIIMIMVIIGLTSWPGYARYIRAEYLKLRSMDYVQAALSTGLPLNSILFRHMLPNGVAPVLVTASFGVAVAILSEASLSFLGLGVVDEPSWGQMLNQAVNAGQFSWWLALFPGAAIFFTVFAYNLIGEALRDAIDPHLKKVAN